MLKQLFEPMPAAKFNKGLLEEAQRALVQHEAAAEYHIAQAELCRARIARLTAQPAAEVSQ